MTVVFQDKIIYLPYLPPFARYEKIDDYAALCRPVEWELQNITSLDGTKLAICAGSIPGSGVGSAAIVDASRASASRRPSISIEDSLQRKKRRVVICYFQGNGGSTPPRLPLLSNVLKHLHAETAGVRVDIEFTIIALSYRGFWKSSGRASQIGIEQDAQALLHHVAARYGGDTDVDLQIILWGQSIGAAVALTAASTYLSSAGNACVNVPLLILETPFTSIKAMLLTLYPQKWLPYRYLWPFLWNHWDSEAGLRNLANVKLQDKPEVLLVGATSDEVVPAGEADRLEEVSREVGLVTHRRHVIGALHTDATIRIEGRRIICDFIVAALGDRQSERTGGKAVEAQRKSLASH
jgi:pimeloyl-ACP methyl ester carboxylesterase